MMKQGWEYKPFGEMVHIIMGQSPSSDTYNDSKGLPFFQGNADFGRLNPKVRVFCNAPIRIAEPFDILISVRAPIGAINIADRKCCIGRGLAAVRSTDKTLNKFIYYYLIKSQTKLISQGTGSTFKSIGKDVIKKLLFPVIEIAEQERIVEELDLLSGIIEKQKQQLKELDTLAQSIFYDMFGDPVTNEKGWEVKKMGEIGSFQRGGGFLKKDFVDCGVPCIHYGQIHTKFGPFSKKNLSYISQETAQKSKFAYPKDIIIAITSEDVVGSCKSVAWLGKEKVAVGGHSAIFSHNQNPIFIAYYMRTNAFNAEKAVYAHGFKVVEIKPTEIAKINIFLPPLHLQDIFEEAIFNIEKQKDAITKAIEETQKLFDYTMDKYFG